MSDFAESSTHHSAVGRNWQLMHPVCTQSERKTERHRFVPQTRCDISEYLREHSPTSKQSENDNEDAVAIVAIIRKIKNKVGPRRRRVRSGAAAQRG